MGSCISKESSARKSRTLYIILPYSNPVKFKTREKLLKQTVAKLQKQSTQLKSDRIEIVVSQLVFGSETAMKFNKFDVVHRTDNRNVLWSKENLINLGVQQICRMDPSANYFAWVDADITFSDPRMFSKILDEMDNHPRSLIQLWSQAELEGENFNVKSFGYQHSVSPIYKSVHNKHADYWHPGFAWGMTRNAFNAVGGLIERTLGSADRHMAMCVIGLGLESVPPELQNGEYGAMILKWQQRAQNEGITLKYVPGKIIHSYHGTLENRQYMGRWQILIKHKFSPSKHMKSRSGLIEWSDNATNQLVRDVIDYFENRNEDEDNNASPGCNNDDNQSYPSNGQRESSNHEESYGHAVAQYANESYGEHAPESNGFFPSIYAGGA